MRIVLLSSALSIHTVRWANGLAKAGHTVHVISQHPMQDPFDEGVMLHFFPFRGIVGYFLMVPGVRALLRSIKPDIVNAHYASGYGTTARLVGYRPWMLSVWGSDVYDFPYKSPVHKHLVIQNLKKADGVASTSNCMARQTRSLCPGLVDISITPFGVDIAAYTSSVASYIDEAPRQVTIGTVKAMADKYGIDTLIEAFSLVRNEVASRLDSPPSIALRLVGDGPEAARLGALVDKLDLNGDVNFVGQVPHHQVPLELAKLDIYVALSRMDSESFGVAILEAGAAGKPVVVSDAGGLPEVTLDGRTGIVVPRENPRAAADAILRLINDANLRHSMGMSARAHVEEHYSWDACVEAMIGAYQLVIERAH